MMSISNTKSGVVNSHAVYIGNETISNSNQSAQLQSPPALLFGVNMNYFSRPVQLVLCIVSIFFLFILYGYCQVS